MIDTTTRGIRRYMAWWMVFTLAAVALATERIDRQALVSRHNVKLSAPDIVAPLSVGNGRFCFTADITGLQTFADAYTKGIPLATMADWAWHSFPNPEGYKLEDTLVDLDSGGRMVSYPINTRVPAAQWLRSNPHRFSLARIGLALRKTDNAPLQLADIHNADQQLDLWQGLLSSRFELNGKPVFVQTCCAPDMDAVAVRIESPLLDDRALGVSVAFPYPLGEWGKLVDDWSKPDRHITEVVERRPNLLIVKRTLDEMVYYGAIQASANAKIEPGESHQFTITSTRPGDALELVFSFSDEPIVGREQTFASIRVATAAFWPSYWQRGGAIDLSQSRDPRWRELERRIVLSQYLTAIQSRGGYPPQETGLTCNSWHGKFHLEMHWWHTVHFALWGRPEVLEHQMQWYLKTLPIMRETARRQGYTGVRWGKMLGPDGREAPSPIGPLLIWQQPHPIYYAELMYRLRHDRQTLEKYAALVEQSAQFMADFVRWDAAAERYVLGPPLIPAQEKYDYRTTLNPTFELCYWQWGLEMAQQWRQRLGKEREPRWDRILANLSALPKRDGIYTAIAIPPFTETVDHPSMLAALGMLPPTPLVDEPTMRRTARWVFENWQWNRAWGWDFPMLAMTAARCGDPKLAVDALFIDTPKNRYLPNGHNYQSDELILYLSSSGGLLSATAMMAAGWDGCPARPAPGFPDDGSWTVLWEGLEKMP